MTSDVPDGTVVAGVPAKVVMTTEEYADRCLSKQKHMTRKHIVKTKKHTC